MNQRKLANSIKATWRGLKIFTIFSIVLFAITTLINDEFAFLLKQKNISLYDAHSYGFNYIIPDYVEYIDYSSNKYTYSDSQNEYLKDVIQGKIIKTNIVLSMLISFCLIVLFFVIKGIIYTIRFTIKHSD